MMEAWLSKRAGNAPFLRRKRPEWPAFAANAAVSGSFANKGEAAEE